LATYFLGNGEDGAFLAVSEDGFNFSPLFEPNCPFLSPSVGRSGIIRDPCLHLGPDNVWTLVWTCDWYGHSLGIARSQDLVRWSEPKEFPVMEDKALNVWAPEIVYEPTTSEYVLFWSSTIPGRFDETLAENGDRGAAGTVLNHRFYYTTTKDFETLAPTRLLYDPGFNCIDATMIREAGRWLLFGKNETKSPIPEKNLFVAESKIAVGPFTMLKERITGDFWAEGPTAVRDGNGFRIYFDRYVEGKWGAVESDDLLKWRDVSEQVQMVPGARHGTVLRVEIAMVQRLKGWLTA
jgi:hypothetical protein